MRRPIHLLFALLCLLQMAAAQTSGQNSQNTSKTASSASGSRPTVNATLQMTVDRLTQSNRDLLDLLKKQQAVLEDIQYDRRLQSRQIESLEERLEETLLQNAQLQNKVSNLEAAAAVTPTPAPAAPAAAPPATPAPTSPPAVIQPATPQPPSTYLPPPPPDSEASGAPSWHRIMTLSGTDSKDTGLFHIDGSTWRIFWHNLDKPGTAYQNTSALFIDAFPKDDTIPQKVCSKLGTGGDSTELIGPGNYYLKIEASGGSWELAVEDYH